MTTTSQVARVRTHMLRELRLGARPPGTNVSVKELATVLRVSPTPVREALERLVGEGLVVGSADRHGFAVPRFGTAELADMFAFEGMLLECAYGHSAGSSERQCPMIAADATADPARAVERAFSIAAMRSRNRALAAAISRSANILAPYRRLEPTLIADWYEGVVDLCEAFQEDRDPIITLRTFVSRRISAAAEFADGLQETPSF
jgi:DNA-binding GntR family transcriptional regulator